MLAARDGSMKKDLEARDVGWLKNLQPCKDSLRLNTQEQINNRCTLESIGKRQRRLVKCRHLRLGHEDSVIQEESATAKHPNFLLYTIYHST